MSCHVMSCFIISCLVMSCYVIPCPVLSSHVISCPVLSCHVMLCPVLSCHVMLYHVLSCHVMSCHVISYLSLSLSMEQNKSYRMNFLEISYLECLKYVSIITASLAKLRHKDRLLTRRRTCSYDVSVLLVFINTCTLFCARHTLR